MPTHGTSAYKYESVATQPKKTVKKGVSKKKKASSFGRNAFSVAVFTVLAFVLLFRYACITEMSTHLAALKSEYDSVSSIAVAKEFALQQSVDLKRVEEIATGELGMQRPEKHQIVYVDMHSTDYIETANDANDGSGFFAVISGAWEKLWEYFS